jgi:hypothetical protein
MALDFRTSIDTRCVNATTCLNSPTVCGTSVVIAPTITGSTVVCSPIVCATSCTKSPILCATSCVSGSLITGTTFCTAGNIYLSGAASRFICIAGESPSKCITIIPGQSASGIGGNLILCGGETVTGTGGDVIINSGAGTTPGTVYLKCSNNTKLNTTSTGICVTGVADASTCVTSPVVCATTKVNIKSPTKTTRDINIGGCGLYSDGNLEMAIDKVFFIGPGSLSDSDTRFKLFTVNCHAYFDYYDCLCFRSGPVSSLYTATLSSGGTLCTNQAVCTPIVCATTCFVGSGAGLTGTASSLTTGSATNALALCGCVPSCFACGSFAQYTYGLGTAGWIRIASTNSNGYGIISISNSYYNNASAPIVFSFGTTYRSAGYITQIGGTNTLISKARIVYPTASDDPYYIEIYNTSTSTQNTNYITMTNTSQVTLNASYAAGSVPGGYSSNELTFTNGLSSQCICTGTIDLGACNNYNYITNSCCSGGLKLATGNGIGTLCDNMSMSSAGAFVCSFQNFYAPKFIENGTCLAGTYLGINATANNATCLNGIPACYYVYGCGCPGSCTATAGTYNPYEPTMYKSGFWEVTGAGWTPTTNWYWGLTAAHTSNGPAYNYSMNLIGQNSADNYYLRYVAGGTPGTWRRIWTSFDVTAFCSTNTVSTAVCRDGNGDFCARCLTVVDVIVTSDSRLKTDIKPIQNALSTVLHLCGVGYCMCGDVNCEKHIGLIAQDTKKVLPEIVSVTIPDENDNKYGIDDEKLGVKYGKLTAVLVEAIKELDKKVNCLCCELNYWRNYNTPNQNNF